MHSLINLRKKNVQIVVYVVFLEALASPFVPISFDPVHDLPVQFLLLGLIWYARKLTVII